MESTSKAATLGGGAAAAGAVAIDGPRFAGDVSPLVAASAVQGLGEPSSPKDLALRVSRLVARLWPSAVASDLFLPRPSGALQGLCDPRTGETLLAALRSGWGPIATQGLMPMRPMRLSGDLAAGWGPTMSAPVLAGSSLEGFLVVQRAAGDRDFSAIDVESLSVVAHGVGRVLPTARARSERSERSMRTWQHQDMLEAREVQRTFLPVAGALGENSANAKIAAEYMPAFAVGGDFYDVIDLGDGRILAAIGDVSGKGVNAALIMARLSSELRRLATQTSGPADLLSELNRSLAARLQDDRFVTVVCALLDTRAQRWSIANAGHPLPLLRRNDGRVSRIAHASGPPIGIDASSRYAEQTYAAEAGDILVLVTDGAFDLLAADRPESGTIGHSRLTDLVAAGPHDVADIARRIVANAEAAVERDDVALLGLQLPL